MNIMKITEESLPFFKNLLLEFSYHFNNNPILNQSKNSNYKNYSKIILTNEFSKNIYSNKKKIPDILTASLYSTEKHLSDNQFQYIMKKMCANFNEKIEQKDDNDCCWLVQLDGLLQTLPEKPISNNSVANNPVKKKPTFVFQENVELINAQPPNVQLQNAQPPKYSQKIKLVIPFSDKEVYEITFFEMTSLTEVDDVSIEMYPGIFIEKPKDIPNINDVSCEVLLQLHKSSQNNSWIGFSEYKKSRKDKNAKNAKNTKNTNNSIIQKEYKNLLNKKQIVSDDTAVDIEKLNSYQKRCQKYYRNEYSNGQNRMPGAYNSNQINQKTEVLTNPNKLVNGIRIKTSIKSSDYIPLSAYLHTFSDEIEATEFSHKNPIIAFTSFNYILSAQEFSKNIPLSYFKNITLSNNTKEYVLLFQVQSVDDYSQHNSFQVPIEFLASDGYIIIIVQKPNSKNLIRLYEHENENENENKKKVLYPSQSPSKSQIERNFYRHRVKLLKSIQTYMTVIVNGLTNVCKITALVFEEVEEVK